MVEQGVPMMTASGYLAEFDPQLCGHCATCVDVCPFHALKLNGEVELDWERCMGCGICEVKCPSEAIRLVRDERKGIPLDVRALA